MATRLEKLILSGIPDPRMCPQMAPAFVAHQSKLGNPPNNLCDQKEAVALSWILGLIRVDFEILYMWWVPGKITACMPLLIQTS